MANTAWLINCRAIAKKVKNAVFDSNYQAMDLGAEASRECPNCQHTVDNSDVCLELPGLPAGVKFDPTDAELLEHLAGKAGVGIAKAHIFIDEFIPTLDGEEGICYTHPENLPGVRKDGSNVHFFHRSLNAYSTGNRKRRRIQSGFCETEERVRWHKTGKTKPVLDNGVLKGWKKIMVLYRSSGKGSKPDKANWVLHQYHLGMEEEEKDGDLVVSKIFYQRTKQMDCNETETVREKSNFLTVRYCSRSPATMNPQQSCSKMNPSYEADEHVSFLLEVQEEKAPEVELPPSTFPIINLKNEKLESNLWAGESQAIEEPNPQLINESLLCSKVLINFPPLEKSSLQLEKILHPSSGHADNGVDSIMSCVQQCDEIHAIDHSSDLPDVIFSQLNYSNTIPDCIDQLDIDADSARGFPSLENIEVDTPPDFQLSDLQFGSQDSITSWLDRL